MTPATDIRTRLSIAGRGNVLMTLVTMTTSLVAQAGMGRVLGTNGLGEYNGTMLFISIISSAFTLGAPAALSQQVATYDEADDPRGAHAIGSGFTLFLAAGAIAVLTCATLWGIFHAALAMSSPADVALVAAATFANVIQIFVVSILLARLQMGAVTGVVIAQPLAVLVGLSVTQGLNGSSGSVLAAIGSIAGGVAGILDLTIERIRPRFQRRQITSLLHASFPATMVLYVTLVTSWIDRSIVGLIIGTSGLGAFAAASAFTEGILRIPRNAGTFGVAAYARLQDDEVGVNRVFDSHIRILAAFFIVAGTVLIAGGRGFLTLVFGPTFSVATSTLALLAVALLPMGLTLAVASSTVGLGRGDMSLRLMSFMVPAQVVVGTLGTLALSITGMALAQVLVWVATLALYGALMREGRNPLQARTLLRIAGVSVPLYVMAFLLGRQALPWALPATISAVVSCSSVGLFILRAADLRLLRRLVEVQNGSR